MTVLGRPNKKYTIRDLYAVNVGQASANIFSATSQISCNNIAFHTQYIPQFGGGYITSPTSTYTDIVNISGSGSFLFAISGAPYPTTTVNTFRITIDGQSREIEALAQVDDRTLVMAEPNSIFNSTQYLTMRSNYNYTTDSTPRNPGVSLTLPGPSHGHQAGIRFENECRVELKTSVGYYIGLRYEYCAAAVFLDQ